MRAYDCNVIDFGYCTLSVRLASQVIAIRSFSQYTDLTMHTVDVLISLDEFPVSV